jgi:hypothetical protein
MMDILGLFTHPVELNRLQQLLLLLPLCLTISVVYKTTKCANVRDIPLAVAVSWITIVIGMYSVGAGLILLYNLLA